MSPVIWYRRKALSNNCSAWSRSPANHAVKPLSMSDAGGGELIAGQRGGLLKVGEGLPVLAAFPRHRTEQPQRPGGPGMVVMEAVDAQGVFGGGLRLP